MKPVLLIQIKNVAKCMAQDQHYTGEGCSLNELSLWHSFKVNRFISQLYFIYFILHLFHVSIILSTFSFQLYVIDDVYHFVN